MSLLSSTIVSRVSSFAVLYCASDRLDCLIVLTCLILIEGLRLTPGCFDGRVAAAALSFTSMLGMKDSEGLSVRSCRLFSSLARARCSSLRAFPTWASFSYAFLSIMGIGPLAVWVGGCPMLAAVFLSWNPGSITRWAGIRGNSG